ncbi:MAG: hypothetical protein ACOCZR_05065 [Halanaerobiales bacterium]
MKRYDLDVAEIVRLKEEEGMTYEEITEELGYSCHPDTVGRRYRTYKDRQRKNKRPLEKDYATRKIRRPWWMRLWDWLWR